MSAVSGEERSEVRAGWRRATSWDSMEKGKDQELGPGTLRFTWGRGCVLFESPLTSTELSHCW